jgi:hypothetical protein
MFCEPLRFCFFFIWSIWFELVPLSKWEDCCPSTGISWHGVRRYFQAKGKAKIRRKNLSTSDPRLFEYVAPIHTDLHVLDELVVRIDLAHMLFDLNRTLNGYHFDWLILT